jgi:hypothetical protein
MIEIEILLTFVYFLECTMWGCSFHLLKQARPWMLANLRIICQFHTHSVHQNSVEIFWAEIYRGRLLTLITGSSSRLLRIRFSADLSMYWFPVYHFRCMKFKPLVIWIWNQNIAISTIVGTSSHITDVWNWKK